MKREIRASNFVMSIFLMLLAALTPPGRVWAQPAADAAAVDLAPRFEIGAPVRYEHILTMTQKQTIGQFGGGTISLQLISDLRFVATRPLVGGGAEVELTFDRLSIDVVPAEAPRAVYDTEADAGERDDEPFVRALRRVAQTAVVFEVDSAGRATPIAGAREIVRLLEGLDGYEVVAMLFNPRWLRELVQDVYGPSHDKPRRSFGETWEIEQALWLGGAPGARTTVRWKIDHAEGDLVQIVGDGTTTPPVRLDENLRGLEEEVSGVFSRFGMVWDSKLGRTRVTEKSQAMTLTYRMEGASLATITLGGHSLMRAADRR